MGLEHFCISHLGTVNDSGSFIHFQNTVHTPFLICVGRKELVRQPHRHLCGHNPYPRFHAHTVCYCVQDLWVWVSGFVSAPYLTMS